MGIVFGLDDKTNGVQFEAKARNSLLHSIQAGCGVQQTSHPIGTGDYVHVSEVAGSVITQLHPVSRIRISPYIFMEWSLFKNKENLTFFLVQDLNTQFNECFTILVSFDMTSFYFLGLIYYEVQVLGACINRIRT